MTDENGSDAGSGRDQATGRFSTGNRASRGRPRGQTVSAELRRQGNPEEIAARLLAIINGDKTTDKIRLEAISLYMDRDEGRAVSRVAHARVGMRELLPGNFEALDGKAQDRLLDELRERALAEAASLPVLDVGGDE